MAELVIEHLVKSFEEGGFVAVDDVSLTLQTGKWLTLLGPSGCGKSTTLNCIAGLETPDSGKIRLGDRVLIDGKSRALPPESRDVGMVFQSYALWPHLTVAGNVGFPLTLRRIPANERKERVREALELVELTGMEHRHPHELSGGQQQRVALARALVYRPKILLLDEPLSNLDAKLRERARAWLTQLQKELKITTVYVTHDQVEALTMSDEVAVMNHGKILQRGSPEDIYRRPASPFVAEFIGTSNLIEGTVVTRNGQQGQVSIAGVTLPFTLPATVKPNDQVFVAVRPERVTLTDEPSHTAIPARLMQRSYLGSKYEYVVAVEGGELKIESLGRIPESAQEIGLQIDSEHCTVFPRT